MTKKTKLRSKKPSKKRTKKKQSGGIGLRQNLKKFDDFRRALLIKWGDENKCLICTNIWKSTNESSSDKKWYYKFDVPYTLDLLNDLGLNMDDDCIIFNEEDYE